MEEGGVKTEPTAKLGRLWVYAVLPAIILNLGGCVIFGSYYGMAAQQPELIAGIGQGQVFFVLYVFINLVEWVFAASILVKLRRDGDSVMSLIAPGDAPWRFRLVPAILVFIAFNALFGAYVLATTWMLGEWPTYGDWTTGQRIFLVSFVPVTAGFCEELIWRGYIITRMEERGRGRWAAILLSAASFAVIHGVLPDRLLVTFLLGVVGGIYYTRERNLIPLMVTHVILDVWSFGLSAFAG
jgi:membrane protease YdiL (CAAX protease family)